MRILAIRGSNLASLAGPFEVNLDAEPLKNTGLFAITGSTGAGKSTILDAMCLALFDAMPRLPGGQGVEVGALHGAEAQRVKHNDVRSILRRGAAEAHAEVDFIGGDGRRYRSRWSVRRARGKAEGRLQSQFLELKDLETEERIGRTKTEVLDAIHQCLGLSFDQFRRAVLLAQGDFAAFLKAGPAQRAELLERITGTEIYSRLSELAYKKAKAEEQKLEQFRQRLGDRQPLDTEQRQALEAEAKVAKTALDALNAELKRLEAEHRWYTDLNKLKQERNQAEQQRVAAEKSWTESASRRLFWRQVSELQPLKTLLLSFDQATATAERAGKQLSEAEVEVTQAADRAAEADKQWKLAGQARDQSQRSLEAARPNLKKARELDVRLSGARLQLAQAQKNREQTKQAESEAAGKLSALEQRQNTIKGNIASLTAWQTEHADLAGTAEHWPAWKRELERYAEIAKAFAVSRRLKDESIETENAVSGQIEMAKQDVAQAASALDRLSGAIADLQQQAGQYDLQQLSDQRRQLLERERSLREWKRLVEILVGQRKQQNEFESERREQVGIRDARKQQAEDLAAEVKESSAGLAEARQAWGRLRDAVADSVEALRQSLKPGHECPVCGAVEHPWDSGEGGELRRLEREQQQRVDQLQTKVDGLGQTMARSEADAAAATRRIAELDEALQTIASEQNNLLAVWRQQDAEELHPADPFQPMLEDTIAVALNALEADLTKIQSEEESAAKLLAAVERERAKESTARQSLEQRQGVQKSLETRLQEAIHAQSQAARDMESAEAGLAERVELLNDPMTAFKNWRRQLEGDTGGFLVDCEMRVAEWNDAIGKKHELEKSQADLQHDLVEARTHAEQRRTEAAKAEQGVAEDTKIVDELQRERRGFFEGRAADEVENGLREHVVDTESAVTTAGDKLNRETGALAAARRAEEDGRRVLKSSNEQAAQAKAKLDSELVKRDIPLEKLRDLAGYDHHWIESERSLFDSLREARESRTALVEERTRKVEEHLASREPEAELASIVERLAGLPAEIEQASNHRADLQGRLVQDDQARKLSEELRQQMAEQQKVWELWESLNELIGSAGGQKFRLFAQGLTLDVLLAHANIHLRDLARRYQLERVPGVELELQVVDREMGDEVRSIHSLSGGESFLVSLALALGLASVASDRVQVESLFIDEGFGALDAEALDMAIASLDALYSLGRQVGVISHISTLVERIGTQVRVEALGGGRSRVRVLGI